MRFVVAVICFVFLHSICLAQTPANATAPPSDTAARAQEIQELRGELARISARLDALERSTETSAPVPVGHLAEPSQPDSSTSAAVSSAPAAAPGGAPASRNAEVASSSSAAVAGTQPGPTPQAMQTPTPAAAGILPTVLPGGATLNYAFDGYYENNFNNPPGRVNDLRAYDVLSNSFSINQADIIFDLQPDLERKRRYGFRLDLQFGQATDTLQGNPANEPRPTIYQNIFQAYGTYVVPLGKGWNIDFGKFASSLGAEGNYTKDQMNYTRSFYFYYLPFYHAGLRTQYHVNDKLAINYWVVNGTQQTEPTNSYKDELFGFILSPTKKVTWTSNYYLGQDHPDVSPSSNCTVPVQPGLCLAPISPAPNGKLHIIDNYVSWNATPKLSFLLEGDYVIEREWANAAPGESSAPSHVDGGAGYVQYQVTPHGSLAARSEYLSDRGGLFSGVTQALKEATGTYKYTVGDGLDLFLEYRRDWSNVPYFHTGTLGGLTQHQDTATVGLVWWYGGKQGAW